MDRELYAEQLLHLSARIVGAVHDDGPDELLEHLAAALAVPAPPGVDPVVALVTVVAAQVDPEASESVRLGWLGGRPHPLAVVAPSRRRRPLQPCGTPAAYKRHHRYGEKPCTACLDARMAQDAARAARRGAA